VIVAPPGSEIHRSNGPPRLKVPRPGNPHEFSVLEANDAMRAAMGRKYGLRFEGLGT
jgi:hypothetical protein